MVVVVVLFVVFVFGKGRNAVRDWVYIFFIHFCLRLCKREVWFCFGFLCGNEKTEI